MVDAKHTPGPDTDDLFILRNTQLPRHHRDAQDEMEWAADEIERLRSALKITYARVSTEKAQDLGFVEALLAKATTP